MRITTRRALALAAAGTMLAVAAAATAAATTSSGETPMPIAHAQLLAPASVNRKVAGGRVKIQTQGALDALMLEITLAPGGTGGWHSHAGPAIEIVKQGTLTIFDAKCKPHELTAGDAVISPGSVSKDENKGATPVTLDVTFLIPHGATSPRIDAPAPTGCNA